MSTRPLQKPLVLLEGSPPQHRDSALLRQLDVLHVVRTSAADWHLQCTPARLPVFLPLCGASCLVLTVAADRDPCLLHRNDPLWHSPLDLSRPSLPERRASRHWQALHW
jgi:hypothetical protein